MMERDLWRELDEFDGQPVPMWQPAEGERLVGTVRRFEHRGTRHGLQQIAVVEREDGAGLMGLWLTSTVIRDAFTREQVQPGDKVGLRFIGKAQSQAGQTYNKYAIVVQKQQQPGEWN